MFRLRIDDSAIADDLTAAQAHVLIGEIFERITMPRSTPMIAESQAETKAPLDAPAATASSLVELAAMGATARGIGGRDKTLTHTVYTLPIQQLSGARA